MPQQLQDLASLLLFGLAVSKITNNYLIGTFAFTLAIINPLIRYYLRIATTNSFSLLLLILNTFLIFAILKKYKHFSLLTLFITSMFLGTLNAATTNIKLNGAFLMIFPTVLLLSQLFLKRKKQKSNTLLIKKFLTFIYGTAIGFISTFYYLEPELWKNPVKGIQFLFGIRLLQQQRFFNYFGKLTIPEVFQSILNIFLSISNSYPIKSMLLFLLLFGILHLIRKSKKDNNKLLLYFSFFVLATNSYYARIRGFDKYLIPSLLILILISSISANKILTNINKKRATS